MRKPCTNQEWLTLIEQSESSSLSTSDFCTTLTEINPSTFYAKRQQPNKTQVSQGFVQDEVVEKTTKYQAQKATTNMTLLIRAHLFGARTLYQGKATTLYHHLLLQNDVALAFLA